MDKEARDEDADELRDELAADLEELDAERDRHGRGHAPAVGADYVPEDDDFVDDVDEAERLTAEEVEAERSPTSTRSSTSARPCCAKDACEAFLKIEPKQLVPDEALYREMRLNYRDYFTGGMGAESVRDLLEAMDLAGHGRESCARSSPRARARSAPRPSSAWRWSTRSARAANKPDWT